MSDRIVVTGLPASGKSTWVREHAKPGDMVWDTDRIGDVVFGCPKYPRPIEVAQAMGAIRNSLIRFAGVFKASIYIIETNPALAATLAREIRGKVVTIECDELERQRRIAARE